MVHKAWKTLRVKSAGDEGLEEMGCEIIRILTCCLLDFIWTWACICIDTGNFTIYFYQYGSVCRHLSIVLLTNVHYRD